MSENGMIIKGCHVIDPVSGLDGIRDIRIRGQMIEQVAEFIPAENGWKIMDAAGLCAFPGLMDAHVHFRDPGFTAKEDLESGSAAAARGGFTRVVCMANTSPAVDTPEVLQSILLRSEHLNIELCQASCISKGLRGRELVDMDSMLEAGAAGFTDDGIPLMDEALLLEAMKKAALLGKPLALHEEDPLFVRGAGVNDGETARKLGYGGASRTAEEVMTARDVMLALHTGARVCIQHISSAASVELVRLGKKLGADIHAEATPHHFTLTEEAVLLYGSNARMNPPLRTEKDRMAIIEGLKDGTIDMIVTDHAPHTREEKARPIDKAPSGIIGLETSLALGIKSLVQPGHISLMDLAALMSTNPARFYGMEPFSIAPGRRADLVLFGEREEWIVSHFASKADNSPFIGWTLPGKIHRTICRGQTIYSI